MVAPVILASGQTASVGRASGPLALSAEAASAFAASGAAPIFVRTEMDADDMQALRVSAGVVTTRGGITGDGAVAARVLGKPCLVGMSNVVIRMDFARSSSREPTARPWCERGKSWRWWSKARAGSCASAE